MAHEALFDGWPELRDWLTDNRELLLIRGQVQADQERWEREGKPDEDFLIPIGRRPDEASDLLERRPDLLLPGMAGFIERSRSRAEVAAAQRQEELAREFTGMLLALEALPHDLAKPERPLVIDAVMALDDACRRQREVAVMQGGPVRLWRVFGSVEELVAAARARLPRELTPEQRARFFLPER